MASAPKFFTDDEMLQACGGNAELFEQVVRLRAELAPVGIVYPACLIGTDGEVFIPKNVDPAVDVTHEQDLEERLRLLDAEAVLRREQAAGSANA